MIRAFTVKTVLAGLALASWTARAEDPPMARDKPPVIGFFDAGKPHCYLRVYDDRHMAAHPKQKVTALAFTYVPEQSFEGAPEPQPMWDQWSEEPAFSAMVVVTLKGESRKGLGSAYCRAGKSASGLACGIEGDGGSFTLTRKDDGRIRLDNPEGFAVEFASTNEDEPNDGIVLIDPKDDHDAFLLAESAGGLCDSKWE